MSRRRKLGRRVVLRGMIGGSAVALGLPLLESMLDDHGEALADGSSLPTRFVTWFWGDGIYPPTFEPSEVGANFALSECLMPFDGDVRPYVTVCTGLRNRCRPLITHHEGMCVFNGYDIQPFSGPKAFNSHMGGPTVDELVADTIGGSSPIRSIHVGVDRQAQPAHGGTTLAALSHAGSNQPNLPIVDPTEVWSTLFGSFSTIDERPLRQGIVTAVKDDLARLQQRLGTLDKMILDKHLESVNALEQEIMALPVLCSAAEQPTETNPKIELQPLGDVCDIMDELIAVAFRCDLTRVATNLFLRGDSLARFWMIGQDAYVHANDNASTGPGDWQQRYTDVVAYCMARIAHLAQTLYDTTTPTGERLLDSTIIYASTDSGPGWSHTLSRQPIVIVGHGRNKLVFPGIHYEATPNTNPTSGNPPSTGNTADALLTVLQAFDEDATQVGDLTGAGTPPGSNTPLEAIRS